MKLGSLTLLQPMHSNGTPIKAIVIAALHWKWSVTWRWSLTWSAPDHARPFWPRLFYTKTHRGYPGGGWCFSAGSHLPWLGRLHLNAQPNMPWKRK